MMLASLFSVFAVGCASSTQIRQGAYAHEQRAQIYQAQGDYIRANDERRAADKQFRKADNRAYDEARATRYWY
jgi:hypothetical protein